MITKELIEKLFSAASIQRWNDHPRPIELTELDKQAHKIIIAYILARLEEDNGQKINWNALIEGAIFEFYHRIVLTDLKPRVFHKLMQEKEKELNAFVANHLQKDLLSLSKPLYERFCEYFGNKAICSKEKAILKAAHYLATRWEFNIIYPIAKHIYGMKERKKEIENEIKKHQHLPSVAQFEKSKKLNAFIDLCGQLRFQLRWAQSPRIPKTNVLGHMLMVAILAYFCSIENGYKSSVRIKNNFFGGLFHDLPEVLTRDIINPIKRSVVGLDEIIKNFENTLVKETLLPMLPKTWHKEINYLMQNEFENKTMQNGKIVLQSNISNQKDNDAYSCVDGQLIEACDKFSAYLEAAQSKKFGITSNELANGLKSTYKNFAGKTYGKVKFKILFDYFKK